MRVWAVLVSDVVEELDLVPGREEARGNRMHGRVAPALRMISLCIVQINDKLTS